MILFMDHEVNYYGSIEASNYIVQPVNSAEKGLVESEVERIRTLLSDDDFMLITFLVSDWNNDLSPWEADPVFGNEGFGKGAEDTLLYVKELIKYFARKSTKVNRKNYYIAGYSLAGLFSLWSAYRTDIFSGIAAVSPSMWFPGFKEFAEENHMQAPFVYLSLGDKEAKSNNQLMKTVSDRIVEQKAILDADGVESVLEWNEGNHFRDVDLRMAKGIVWLLNNRQKQE